MFITKKLKATEVKVGDLIRSRDLAGKTDRYRKVLHKMFPHVDDQLEVVTSDGASLCTSRTHPIAYLSDDTEQYKETGSLGFADIVVTNNGYATVASVRQSDYPPEFIDFEVDQDNNYYAGNDPERLILAHNSATLYYPIWHLEVEDMLVLKNNKGTDEKRIRHMDYGVQFNKLFYERLITGGDITLFSPHDLPEMYDAFFNDQARFRTLYESAERNTRLRKKKLKALDLFTAFMQERKDTGRIYLQNVDNANTHSSFVESKAPIRQSNLCCEITLPTRPMGLKKTTSHTVEKSKFAGFMALSALDDTKLVQVEEGAEHYRLIMEEDDARVALCTLSAINWGNIKTPADFEKPCTLAVRALDALLDYQDYPVRAARLATKEHRPLGIGIINLAYWLAKHDLKYSDGSALPMLDEYAEAWSYYLIKASVDLARERGPCALVNDTKYAQGIMPIDTRKPEVDELVPHRERLPWAQLREDAKSYGIRNSTLTAIMPAETSAQLANATNGIEPPRAYVSIKQSKDGVLKQVVPDFKRLKNKYELLWNQKSPVGYLDICAVLQKYIDQGISVNTSYNPKFYPEQKIPMSELLNHMLLFYKRGGKQLYYNQTNDQAGEIDVEQMTAEQEAEDDEADCDSCKL